MQDIDLIIKWISGLGVSGVLILLVVGLVKGWFVTGREHAVLAGLFTALQVDLSAMRTDAATMRAELAKLRDRDDAQQREINRLREELSDEQAGKRAALDKVDALTKENVGLRARVAELERTVGLNAGPRT